jgi:hypothetical protein
MTNIARIVSLTLVLTVLLGGCGNQVPRATRAGSRLAQAENDEFEAMLRSEVFRRVATLSDDDRRIVEANSPIMTHHYIMADDVGQFVYVWRLKDQKTIKINYVGSLGRPQVDGIQSVTVE